MPTLRYLSSAPGDVASSKILERSPGVCVWFPRENTAGLGAPMYKYPYV